LLVEEVKVYSKPLPIANRLLVRKPPSFYLSDYTETEKDTHNLYPQPGPRT
jgi:hypothetical protein